MFSYSGVWPINSQGFFELPASCGIIKSERGRLLAQSIIEMNSKLQIFMRGSLLESDSPFEKADADLFVLYDNSEDLLPFTRSLPDGYHFDIKYIQNQYLQEDFVFHALLQCRSMQIGGDTFFRTPVAADKLFAWKHWVKYCPPIIPSIIHTHHRDSLLYFKLLVRCFGVISFLKSGLFTRDVSDCIKISKLEDEYSFAQLSYLRQLIEQGVKSSVDVAPVKQLLINQFDYYFKIC
jgi:hypothetical protein